MAERPDVIPSALTETVARDVPLWTHTSIRVGGPARFLARPRSVVELDAVCCWIERCRLPHLILGGGTNVIFPDEGYCGAVIYVGGLLGHRIEGRSLVAAAGEKLSWIARRACEAGLSGLEWACGIPGTVGGAVAMNAGADGGDMAAAVAEVVVHESGASTAVPVERLEMGYRTSVFLAGRCPGVILEARFALRPAPSSECLRRADEMLERRASRLPSGPSVGCVFRNPAAGPTAGELLDRAGCKGLRIGAARVSDRHANVIVNDGRQNADDVLRLIDTMAARVRDIDGIELRTEVVIAGP